jgi:hypothetical protein
MHALIWRAGDPSNIHRYVWALAIYTGAEIKHKVWRFVSSFCFPNEAAYPSHPLNRFMH